jgi:ubiquinone/menaquinone biosynthesis C-methylase UbiE
VEEKGRSMGNKAGERGFPDRSSPIHVCKPASSTDTSIKRKERFMIDFDAIAREWDSSSSRAERARIIAEAIRFRVPLSPTMTAIEYGCGTGLLSFALQPYLAKITLADSSDGMLAALREKLAAGGIENMEPVKMDLLTDPLQHTAYDLVYTLMTLHHITETDRILGRFYNLLDRRGFLCVSDLDQEDGSFHGPDFVGHKGFVRNDLAAKVKRVGFRSAEFTTVFNIVKQVDGRNKTFPLFLMVAEKA